jgi:Fe2+ or Zn2+ uptake regulation protein
MTKKRSSTLLIPAITLLHLTPSLALPPHNHPMVRPSMGRSEIRSLLLQGKMINANTIQVNRQDLSSINQEHIITLTDTHGFKQRFILLTPARSQLYQALLKHHGHLKEFHLYSVVNENGENTSLYASQRIVTAPENQLTIYFASAKEYQTFLAAESQLIAAQNIILASETEAAAIQEEMQHQESEINSAINKANQVLINFKDGRKSTVIVHVPKTPRQVVREIAIPVVITRHSGE